MYLIIRIFMKESKFIILEKQKKELEQKFWVPVFIDIKKEKLYIVKECWEVEYVF